MLAPPGIVALETATLFAGIQQLKVTVGQLHAVDVQLKALPHGDTVDLDNTRQRRLGGGIVVDENHARLRQSRLDDMAHEQIQPQVTVAGHGAHIDVGAHQ